MFNVNLNRVQSWSGRLLVLLLCAICVFGSSVPSAIAIPEETTAAVETWLSEVPSNYYTVGDTNALKGFTRRRNAVLIDVRQPREYRRGHLPDAVNVPLQELAQKRDRLPDDRPLVLYCSTGYRTAMGVTTLRLLGFENVFGFAPSFQAWKAAGETIDMESHDLVNLKPTDTF